MSDSIDQQAEAHAEAWRRSNPNSEIPEGAPPASYAPANAGLKSTDTWNWAGGLEMTTPDLQGPQPPLKPGVTSVAENFCEGNFNAEQIFKNPHGWSR
jgi:hypothetical protein